MVSTLSWMAMEGSSLRGAKGVSVLGRTVIQTGKCFFDKKCQFLDTFFCAHFSKLCLVCLVSAKETQV